jgi:phage-related minor tail protein
VASDTSLVFNLIAKDKATAAVKGAAKAIGAAAATAGAAGATALAAGYIGGLESEAASDRVAASLGLSPGQAEAVAGAAGKVFAGAYAGSMEEASTAVEAVVSSIDGMRNANEQTLADMTIKATNFATAMRVDVGDATGAVGVMLKSGLAEDANQAFDLITAASQKVPVALRQDLLDTTNEYSKHFAGLGFSGHEAMSVLAAASQEGAIGLDKAGDAIKEFQIRSTDMSTTSVDAYKAIGMNAKDMAGKLLAGGESSRQATEDIARGILGIKDPVKQANTAIALFGTPMEDLSADQIPKFLQSLAQGEHGLGNVKGAADAMGATLGDNGKARIDAMRNSMTLWTQEMASTDGALGTASAGVMAFGGDALMAGSQLGTMAIAMSSAGVGAKVAAAGSKVLAVGIRGVGLAMRFAMGPVGLIITAIALVAAGLVYAYNHSSKFRAIVQGAMRGAGAVFKWFGNAVSSVFGWIKRNWPLLLAIITGPIGLAVYGIRKHGDKIIGFLKGLPGRAGRAVRGMWNGITGGFKSAMNTVIGGWNRLSFTLPSVTVFGKRIGGFTLSTPDIPMLAKGGIVTGPTLALLGEGRNPREAVVPLDRAGGLGLGGGQMRVALELVGAENEFLRFMRKIVRVVGRGDVQRAFGT